MLDQTSQWYKLQYPECFVNEEQRMIQKMLADFTDNEIMPVRDKIDDDLTHEKIINPILKKLQVDLGCQKNMIPKEYGGNEMLSIVTGALKQEQIGAGRLRHQHAQRRHRLVLDAGYAGLFDGAHQRGKGVGQSRAR